MNEQTDPAPAGNAAAKPAAKPAWQLELPERKDVFVEELAEHGDWVVAYVTTDGPWPVKTQKVSYRGAPIWIIPVMKNFYPAVAMSDKRPGRIGAAAADHPRAAPRAERSCGWLGERQVYAGAFRRTSIELPRCFR